MKLVFVTFALFGAVAFGAVIPEEIPEGAAAEKRETEIASEEFILPETVKTCEQDNPDLNQCIKDTIQEQIPLLHKGSKALSIPPLDPLEIPNNRFEYSTNIAAGTIILKDVKIYGISKTTIKDVRTVIKDDGLSSEIDIFTPKLFVEGNYKADIKINDIKMRPKGYFNITMSNIGNTAKMAGSFENINGKKHLRLTEFDVDPEIGDMKIFAIGLFPDPTLNSIVLDFANQYWPELYKLVLPETKVHWEPMLLERVNSFLSRVPFDKLLTKKN